MPVRSIKKLELMFGVGMIWPLPWSIQSTYGPNPEFEIRIERHLDREGKFIRNVGEQCRRQAYEHKNFLFQNDPLVLKYGFLLGEYLEIVFLNHIKKHERGIFFKETVQLPEPIFPERDVEEFDIQPT